MAASIATAPASLSLSGDDIWVKLQSDLVNTASEARIDLDFSSSGPALANSLLITWPGYNVLFAVEATTNATATAIPTKSGGETLAEYAVRVVNALRENPTINEFWHITHEGTVGSAERVRLSYKTYEPLEPVATGTIINTTITVTDGVAAFEEDNLAALLQLYTAGATINDDQHVVTLHAPYSRADARATFNLGLGLLPLAPALPNPNTIDSVFSLYWPHDEATAAFAKYYFRYSDKYGTPASAVKLAKSSDYYAIYGSRPGDVSAFSVAAFMLSRHKYYSIQEGTVVSFRKPVSINQPDWIYIWASVAATDCSVEIEITWTNGDQEIVAPSYDPFDLVAKTLYWFVSGPRQIDLAAVTPPAGHKALYYNWRLKGNTGSGETTLLEIAHQVVHGSMAWQEMYLLMDNGFGGCESVLIHGRKKTKYTAERDTARKVKYTDYSVAVGELFDYNIEGQPAWDVNTGYYPLEYIEHLRQLLLGKLWIIDLHNERFLRVVIDTKSVETKDDEQLFSLAFTLRAAWVDKNVHP